MIAGLFPVGDLQAWLATAITAAVLAFAVRRAWPSRDRGPGCGTSCGGCPTETDRPR